jgi:hypothetical protein
MDDYRDLVIAGLAVLCAGLMLVAGLLFILGRPTGQNRRRLRGQARKSLHRLLWSVAPAKHRSLANL